MEENILDLEELDDLILELLILVHLSVDLTAEVETGLERHQKEAADPGVEEILEKVENLLQFHWLVGTE